MTVLYHLGGDQRGDVREAAQKQHGGKRWRKKGTELAGAYEAWCDMQLQTENSGSIMFKHFNR